MKAVRALVAGAALSTLMAVSSAWAADYTLFGLSSPCDASAYGGACPATVSVDVDVDVIDGTGTSLGSFTTTDPFSKIAISLSPFAYDDGTVSFLAVNQILGVTLKGALGNTYQVAPNAIVKVAADTYTISALALAPAEGGGMSGSLHVSSVPEGDAVSYALAGLGVMGVIALRRRQQAAA